MHFLRLNMVRFCNSHLFRYIIMETFTVHVINVKILPCARNPCVFKNAFSKIFRIRKVIA